MPEISGSANIKCNNCGNAFIIDGTDLYFDEVGSQDRNMGMEIIYEANSTFSCPGCGENIELTYDIWEYPVGAFNDSELTLNGAEIVRGFSDIDLSFNEEIYSFDEQSEIYLPKNKEIITNLNTGIAALVSKISATPDLIFKISSREFEELIAHVFSKHGFLVELTKKTRDGGRDIIAIKDDLGIESRFLIECKRYSKHRPISVDLVRNLFGVQMQEGANKSIIATTSYFSPDAIEFSNTKNTTEWLMDLKDYNDILSWINEINDR